jgi:dienelactone hydrolase
LTSDNGSEVGGDDGSSPGRGRPVELVAGTATLSGDLTLPERSRGIVVFAHGSGSSRYSPRNRLVAATLAQAGLGSLLLDLLTPDEEARDARSGALRFDIAMLATRVVGALDWVRGDEETRELPIGCFGASTGAAAALVAAAQRPEAVEAVVSRGGRPDLAGEVLPDVRAPTLLIVGGQDTAVIEMNRSAIELLRCPVRLDIIPGASHLFEEPGALDLVAERAREWFAEHLGHAHASR